MANTNNKKYIVQFADENGNTVYKWTGCFTRNRDSEEGGYDIVDAYTYSKARKFVKHPIAKGVTFKKGKKKIEYPTGLGFKFEMQEDRKAFPTRPVAFCIWEWDGKSGVAKKACDAPCPQSDAFLAVKKSFEDWKAGKDAERAAAKAAKEQQKTATITVAASKASPAKAAAPAVPDGAAEALSLLSNPAILAALKAIGEKVSKA